MEFQEILRKRYSCRMFSPKKVEPELMQKIIAAGQKAPTAINTQPFKIFWLNSNESKDVIRKASNYTFGADQFLIVGYKESEGWNRPFDQRNFADVDASIAATHMLLAIEDAGLNTTWVGHFDAPLLQHYYPQMQSYHLIALFPIGYAAKEATASKAHFNRKDLPELLEIL